MMILERRLFLAGLSALPFAFSASSEEAKPATELIAAARSQIGITQGYDGRYRSLDYPNGDVSRTSGVCTDVVIRAYRDAFDFDLQRAVHLDMAGAFTAYPALWNLSRPDRNIDHRRVPNLETFLTRKQARKAANATVAELEPGDLVTMRLPPNLPHIAIVSDKARIAGAPWLIHNIGAGTREDLLNPALAEMRHARFRYFPPA